MIEIQYVVAFAMAVTNVIKTFVPEKGKVFIPFIAIVLSIAFNLLNAFAFGGDILEAAKVGFVTGGIMIGMFATPEQITKNKNRS